MCVVALLHKNGLGAQIRPPKATRRAAHWQVRRSLRPCTTLVSYALLWTNRVAWVAYMSLCGRARPTDTWGDGLLCPVHMSKTSLSSNVLRTAKAVSPDPEVTVHMLSRLSRWIVHGSSYQLPGERSKESQARTRSNTNSQQQHPSSNNPPPALRAARRARAL